LKAKLFLAHMMMRMKNSNNNLILNITLKKIQDQESKPIEHKLVELVSKNLLNLPENLFNNIDNLSYIKLNNNKIKELPDKIFNNLNLISIDLSQNEIKHIQDNLFLGLKNLKTCKLNDNNLESIKIKNLENLEVVELKNNQLKNLYQLQLENLSKLEILDLSNNKFEHLTYNFFLGIKNIKKLKLNNNELNELDVNVFRNVKKLEVLELNENKFENIYSVINSLLDMAYLKFLCLGRNKFENIKFTNEKLRYKYEKSKNLIFDQFEVQVNLDNKTFEKINLLQMKMTNNNNDQLKMSLESFLNKFVLLDLTEPNKPCEKYLIKRIKLKSEI
jgi:Leucine-rich repeat (LRR) protein